MNITHHYENLEVLHENVCPSHAYFIPASTELDDPLLDRESSDRFQLLNGEWLFQYYENVAQAKEDFFMPGADCSSFRKVTVPGMWQYYGVDQFAYVNMRYPFPIDPPYVPEDNPCGQYLTTFEYHRDVEAPQLFLTFEGVDSCYYVWLNGRYVGYSQVSHATAEFDVTSYIEDGMNTLAVLVLKWCDGSYMEDQDKFRMSGIFRDVYILARPRSYIRDYGMVATPDGASGAQIQIRADWSGEPIPTTVSIYDEEGILVAREEQLALSEVSFALENVHLWNAEQPYLYRVVIETDKEVIVDQLGIRQIEARDGVLYLNNTKIKIHGTNRHDSDPKTGYVISKQQLYKDLTLMKRCNINGIRTSHYPNAPWAYVLYDRLGFYVIDEADNESHGMDFQYRRNDQWDQHKMDWNRFLSDNPDWIEATVDRVKLLVTRDKNRASVIMWSMGNECAYGCTFEAALAWTKKADPTRLTHFESALYVPDTHRYDFDNLDTYSRMYPSIADMKDYLENDQRKPYVLCEYCHAMGNGPGDLEDYFQVIHQYDCACGGMIWEWCDHAIYKGESADGRTRFYYGGDHGEILHDGNFCMDGLVYPDRRLHTGLLEFKHVHRPARVVSYSEKTGALVLHNYMDFLNLKDYVDVAYAFVCDGLTMKEGVIDEILDCPAHEEITVTVPAQVTDHGRCFLRISYYQKNETELVVAGHLLGREEIELTGCDGIPHRLSEMRENLPESFEDFTLTQDDRYIVIEATDFSYRYDTKKGAMAKMTVDHNEVLSQPMEWNIRRAATDNDHNISLKWKEAGYYAPILRARGTEIKVENQYVSLTTEFVMNSMSHQNFLTASVNWRIYGNGRIRMKAEVKRDTDFPMLPRFGLRLYLPKSMNRVTYCGMGPKESYIDKHHASVHGEFKTTVKDMLEDYIRPQENGSHYDCDYVDVADSFMTLHTVGNHFSFNASDYTAEELEAKAHNYELEESPYTVLCLDYKQNGIGSNSCGPELLDAYRFDEEEFTFTLWFYVELK